MLDIRYASHYAELSWVTCVSSVCCTLHLTSSEFISHLHPATVKSKLPYHWMWRIFGSSIQGFRSLGNETGTDIATEILFTILCICVTQAKQMILKSANICQEKNVYIG